LPPGKNPFAFQINNNNYNNDGNTANGTYSEGENVELPPFLLPQIVTSSKICLHFSLYGVVNNVYAHNGLIWMGVFYIRYHDNGRDALQDR
jgi:hypothetical protein